MSAARTTVTLLALAALMASPAPRAATLEARLVAAHGEGERPRVRRGLAQLQALWRTQDGDLEAFAADAFVPRGPGLDALLARFEAHLEQLDGHGVELGRALRGPSELEIEPVLPVDELFAGFEPLAHLVEDLFATRLAFHALLNFPLTTVDERAARGARWSRREWAEARLALRFGRRIPSSVQQAQAAARAASEAYVARYDLWAHHVLSPRGERLFPLGQRLLAHWNLRDEVKAAYGAPGGLARQRALVEVMKRIVTQSIPAVVIDNPGVDWEPRSNVVTWAPGEHVEAPGNGGARPAPEARREPRGAPDAGREADVRYARWLDNARVARAVDAFAPDAPSPLQRAFASWADLPEARVLALLEGVLDLELGARVARVIQRRLGRPLEPADVWYQASSASRGASPVELDARVRERYPDASAFERDLPRILEVLGFAPGRARELASRIRVEAARGAGHALGPGRRGDTAHLRTRIGPAGMDFKGFHIALHELGHNVEQLVSLYDVDRPLLAGVPNAAITEAIAMVFQARSARVLGLEGAGGERGEGGGGALEELWATRELAGVARVDIEAWRWLEAHPKASAAELRAAVVAIAQDVWNRSFAPLLGERDVPILGVYSHSVSYPLYLMSYPLGRMAAAQLEERLRDGRAVGPAVDLMAREGALTVDLWMRRATGAPLGSDALVRAALRALEAEERP